MREEQYRTLGEGVLHEAEGLLDDRELRSELMELASLRHGAVETLRRTSLEAVNAEGEALQAATELIGLAAAALRARHERPFGEA